MRFHIGISFRWKTIKKFLIPIILGIIAYLGFGGIFDHFNIPLGIIKVFASENYNTSYTYNYTELSVFESNIDSNVTYLDFFDDLKNIESDYYKIIISSNIYIQNNVTSVSDLFIILVPKSYSSINFSFFGQKYGTSVSYSFSSLSSYKYYYIDLLNNSYSDIYSSSFFTDLSSCLTSDVCNNYLTSNFNYTNISESTTVNSENSNSVLIFPYSINTNRPSMIYYSSVPLVLSNSCPGGGVVCLFKKLSINKHDYTLGDYFPTYFDTFPYEPIPDEPIPDEPTDDSTTHKGLFNKIYWFDDKNTIYGVLTSIYELLFLYCLTMVLFKVATLLKNKRW